MKKILLVFFMAVSAVVLLASTSFAAGTGNLVIHFQNWDGDYAALGFNSWGDDAVPGLQDPDAIGWMTDDFGIYKEINGLVSYEEGVTEGAIGIQVVGFDGESGSWSANWSMKKANFEVPREQIQDGKTTHVYAFEGSVNRESDISSDLYADPIFADPDMQGVIVVYFDASNGYEENLGVHSWGWAEGSNAANWNEPLQMFQKVGRTSAGTFVYAGILEYADPMGTPGAIVYYGNGDDSKKTGNLEPANSENAAYIETPKAAGELDVIYVLNKGDANTTNNNVWVNDPMTFGEEAFSFRLVDFDADEMTGTYAVDPTTIIVKLSSLVSNPYADAVTEEEQTAAEETVASWFTVKEVTGADTYGDELAVDHVDFAKSNATLDTFVVVLADELDNTMDYEIFFDLGMPEEALAVAKDVTVTLNVTVPEDNTEAIISIGSNVNGWTPGDVDYAATQVGTTNVWTLTFTVSVLEPYTTIEYKWTNGTWDITEQTSGNRTIVIPNNGADSYEFDDVIAWTGDQYDPTARGEATVNLRASLEVAMDTEAPEISFLSPLSFAGQTAENRIIEVPWGVAFDQNLFPNFRAEDDRDGDLTVFVYVPAGSNSTLDTRTEADYTIMLRVEDRWGNVTEETFIFRVVAE